MKTEIIFPNRETYLFEFLLFILSKNPNEPKYISIIRKDFFKLMKSHLTRPPQNYIYKKSQKDYIVEVNIPKYNDLNTTYNWYLAPSAQKLLIEYLRTNFWSLFFSFMQASRNNSFENTSVLIELFLNEHQIDLKHTDTLLKKDLRKRKSDKKYFKEKTSNFKYNLSEKVFCVNDYKKHKTKQKQAKLKKPKKTISIRVDTETKNTLKNLAQNRNDTSVSEITREIIDNYITNFKTQKQ